MIIDLDKLKGKGFTVDNSNNLHTVEFSYPYSKLVDALYEVGHEDADEIAELQGKKRNIGIQFYLDNNELQGISFLVENQYSLQPLTFEIDLNYFEDELDDINNRINQILNNKEYLIGSLNYLDTDIYKANDRFSDYVSGYETSNKSSHNNYDFGRKVDRLPDLNDYDEDYEDDYYER